MADPQPASDKSPAASDKTTAAGDERPARPARPINLLGLMRWMLRAALTGIAVVCLVVAALQGRFGGGDATEGADPMVTLTEGPRYGEAVVGVGAEAPAGDEAVRVAAREAAGRGGPVVVQVAPGVPQREVDRVLALVASELPADGQVLLTLGKDADQAE